MNSAVLSETTHLPTGAPDWSLVPFEVGCARCRQDLRGLVDPKCPACALEFDWSVAVPVEELTCSTCGYRLYGLTQTRCPECGTDFTWAGALAEHHRRRNPLFEYQWRKKPVRSFFRTCRLSASPWRMWRMIDLHDPPRVGALTIMAIMAIIAFAIAPAVLLATVRALYELIEAYQTGGVQRLTSSWRWSFPTRTVPTFMVPLVTWGVVVFCTLATMRWSMARCGIRAVHLFRICVYSFLFVTMQPMLFFMAAILALSAAWGLQWAGLTRMVELGLVQSFLAGLLAIMICVTVLWPFLFLGLAYRRYVRMRHAWGVALAAHVAGLLAVLIALVCLKVRFLILGFW